MSDIKEILNNIGYQNLKDFGSWYRTRPIYRSSDNDTVLAINKNTGYWYDYKLCKGGRLSELVQITLNLNDLSYADKMLAEKFNFTGVVSNPDKTIISQVKIYNESMLDGLVKDHSYWFKRGIKEETVAEFKGGTANGTSEIQSTGRTIFGLGEQKAGTGVWEIGNPFRGVDAFG